MTRQNFSAKTKAAIRERAQGRCEAVSHIESRKPTDRNLKASEFDGVKCANETCERQACIKSPGVPVCNRHYQHWRTMGRWDRPDGVKKAVCVAEGCGNPVRSPYAEKCETHYYRDRRGSALGDGPIHPPCLNCGASLSGNHSKYCSDQCMRDHQYSIMEVRLKRWNTAHKQRCIKAGLAYENVDLFAMFEAAGWVCYICSDAIDPELRHPHQMSPSVDHEIALKAGGGHTAKNCRASHLGCNLHKARKRDSKIIAKVRRLRGETGQKKRRDERKAKEADRLQGKTGNGPKRKIPSRPMAKAKRQWPKRKMQSRGFER